jgi:hypothetical protein
LKALDARSTQEERRPTDATRYVDGLVFFFLQKYFVLNSRLSATDLRRHENATVGTVRTSRQLSKKKIKSTSVVNVRPPSATPA